MADGIDFVCGGDYAVFRVHQNFQNCGNGLGMGGHGNLPLHLLVLGRNLVRQTAVEPDALAETFGGDSAGLRVHQLILQAGAAGVDNQNVHLYDPPVNCDFIFSDLVIG